MKYLTVLSIASAVFIGGCSAESGYDPDLDQGTQEVQEAQEVQETKPAPVAQAKSKKKSRKWWYIAGASAATVAYLVLNDGGGSSKSPIEPIEPMPKMPDPMDEEEMEDPMDKEDPMDEEDPMDKEDPMDEDEEETEEEMDEPEQTPEQIAWGMWNKTRQTYDIMAAVPAPMHAGETLMMSGTKPNASFSYNGKINGIIAPSHTEHISDPEITLRINDAITGINAEVSWMYVEGDEDAERVIMSRYGARLDDDGTFSSFSDRDTDMTAMDGNPTGFNGAFYGSTYDAVAGNVVTPRVYGTFQAEIE